MKIVPAGEAISTIFLIALIGHVNSATNALDSTLENKCGAVQFRCRNGDCIGSELLCDGRADCSDQSDETQEECTKPGIVCPEYAYRCTYGACIDGDLVCNGINDCIDRSDELLPRCGNTWRNASTTAGCSKDEFRCNNGQCVPGISVCDGPAECEDRSDETGTLCGTNECPSFNFRCAYGACIEDRLKCNNVRNCADGSDEDPELCRGISQPTPGPSRPPNRPPIPSYPPPQPAAPACPVPAPLPNGRWQLHKDKCPTGEHCTPGGQVRLGPGTQIVYSCNTGYALKGSSNVFCTDTGSWSTKPVCVEVRCKPLTTASTEASCTYKGEWTSCEGTVLPGTVAKVTCRNGYSPGTRGLSTERDNVVCKPRGHWEPEPIRCIPVCGVTSPKTKPLSTNAQLAEVSDFPWHATLYRDMSPTKPKQFICGATIIQNDLLITAAHCVWDEATKSIENPNKYAVATGNVFRDFNSIFHNPIYVKQRNVTHIYMDCNYLGFEGNYASDIAILRVDQPFQFSAILMPICLDTQTRSDLSILEVGNYGKVAGFGKTAVGGDSSGVLQYLNVPYVPLSQCKATSTNAETEKFITVDKFCAGYTNGTSVCDGDSGGGLVFKTGGLWYLRGIVSVDIGAITVGGVRSCDPYTYSLYTKVSNHIGWIQDVIIQLEWYNSFPACPKSNHTYRVVND